MREIRNILTRAHELNDQGGIYVIATVVNTRGSTYRGLGARMLIEPNSSFVGTLSAGCIENELLEVTKNVIKCAKAKIVNFDYTSDDDFLFGTGMGCSGQLEILVVPMPSDIGKTLLSALNVEREYNDKTILSTITDPINNSTFPLGQTFTCKVEDISKLPYELRPAVTDFLKNINNTVNNARRYTKKDFGIDMLVEVVPTPTMLTVFGAGNDVIPLVFFADYLGWDIQVIDHRPALTNRKRFPRAKNTLCTPAGKWPDGLNLPPKSAAMVMSHNYLQDQAMLSRLLTLDLGYIGILGPQERSKRLINEIERSGIKAVDSTIIHAPAGLNLGGDCPQSIALALMAEMHAFLNHTNALPLRLSNSLIHPGRQNR